MGDRERTNGSNTRWCAVHSRATVHQVTAAHVPANEHILEVTEKARARDYIQTISSLINIKNKVKMA